MPKELGLCSNESILKEYHVKSSDFDGTARFREQSTKRVCQDCPVQLLCFNEAVAYLYKEEEVVGIWGGHTVQEIADLLEAANKTGIGAVRIALGERQKQSQLAWEEIHKTA